MGLHNSFNQESFEEPKKLFLGLNQILIFYNDDDDDGWILAPLEPKSRVKDRKASQKRKVFSSLSEYLVRLFDVIKCERID